MLSNQPKFKFAFLGIDFFVMSMAFGLAFRRDWCASCIFLYVGFIAAQCFSFLYNDLYKRNILTSRRQHTFLIAKSLLFGVTAVVILLLFIPVGGSIVAMQKAVPLLFFYAFALAFVARPIVGRTVFLFLAQQKLYRPRILILGGGEPALRAAQSLTRSSWKLFDLVGFIDGKRRVHEEVFDGFVNLGRLEDLNSIISSRHVDEILIAEGGLDYAGLMRVLEPCLKTGKVVRIYSSFLAVIAERMKVEFYEDIPVVMLSQKPYIGSVRVLKRGFDVIVSSLAMVLLSPLFLIVAAGIKLSSRGPVIFRQTRIGTGGKSFSFYKFRSMHVGNDSSAHKEYVRNFIKESAACKNTSIRVFKISHDPRIFPFGKFIRKASIDELPQLYNVLKGDMSLVGPRPCLPYEWECYSDWHKNRLDVLPGCTGLWQALGRSSVTFEEMVILDLYYVNNLSLWLDIKIMLKTIPVIFFGKGGF